MAPPRDSPVRSSWPSITLLPWPRLRPVQHKPVSIPRAVCAWYKPDRRRSGRGSVSRPSLLLRTHGRGAVYPSVPGVQRRRRRGSGGLWLLPGSPLLPPGPVGGVPLSRQHVQGDGTLEVEGQSQVEEEHLHAMLPSHSPIMRQQVAPGSSLKSLSRGSCWASRVWESLHHHPQPAPARRPGPHLPGPTSSSSLPSGLCCAPGSPAPLCTQPGFLI